MMRCVLHENEGKIPLLDSTVHPDEGPRPRGSEQKSPHFRALLCLAQQQCVAPCLNYLQDTLCSGSVLFGRIRDEKQGHRLLP